MCSSNQKDTCIENNKWIDFGMIVYEVDISGICLVYPSTWYITGIYQTYVVHTILYGFQMNVQPSLVQDRRASLK